MKKLWLLFGFCLLLLVPIASALTAPTGGVSYYNFSSTTDLWGSNDATNYGATSVSSYPSFNTSGNSGPNSYSFDGSNDYILIPDDSSLETIETISLWFKADDVTTTSKILQIGQTTISNGWGFLIDISSSKVRAFTTDGTTTILVEKSVVDDTWYHVVLTQNRNTNVLSLYVDGVFVDNIATGSSVRFVGGGLIGAFTTVSDFFSGEIDEIKFYDYVLNQTEISNLYNYGNISGASEPVDSSDDVLLSFKDINDDAIITPYNLSINGDSYTGLTNATFNFTPYFDFDSYYPAENFSLLSGDDFSSTDEYYFGAMSGDGNVLAMIESYDGNELLYSFDAGDTWDNKIITEYFARVAVSNYGSIYATTSSEGYVYISHDQGATWSSVQPSGGIGDLNLLAVSGDGDTLLVEDMGASVWLSTDAGETFTELEIIDAYTHMWGSFSINDDGSVMIATTYDDISDGRVYVSTDGGTTWSEKRPKGDADYVWDISAVSGDGDTLLVGEQGARLWKSTDDGATWSDISHESKDKRLYDVDINEDGSVMVKTYGPDALLSINGGTTWTKLSNIEDLDLILSNQFKTSRVSSDGNKIFLTQVGSVESNAYYWDRSNTPQEYDITFSSDYYFSKSWSDQLFEPNNVYNFSGLYSTNISFSFSYETSSTYNLSTIKITNLNTSEEWNTSTGFINLGEGLNGTYTFQFEDLSGDYFPITNRTLTFTPLQEETITISLKPYYSVFSFKDLTDFDLITQQVNYTIQSSSTTINGQTSNGTTSKILLDNGLYTLTARSEGYLSNQIVFTVNNDARNLTLYLDEDTESEVGDYDVIFKIIDQYDNIISDAVVTISLIISGESYSIGQKITDLSGSVVFNINFDREYILVVAKEGYETFTGNLIPTTNQYVIRINELGGEPITSIYEDITTQQNAYYNNETETLSFTFFINSNSCELNEFSLWTMVQGVNVTTGASTACGGLITATVNPHDLEDQNEFEVFYSWTMQGGTVYSFSQKYVLVVDDALLSTLDISSLSPISKIIIAMIIITFLTIIGLAIGNEQVGLITSLAGFGIVGLLGLIPVIYLAIPAVIILIFLGLQAGGQR